MPQVRIIDESEVSHHGGRGSSADYIKALEEARSELKKLKEGKALLLVLGENEREITIKGHYQKVAKELGLDIRFSRQDVRQRNGKDETSAMAVSLK